MNSEVLVFTVRKGEPSYWFRKDEGEEVRHLKLIKDMERLKRIQDAVEAEQQKEQTP